MARTKHSGLRSRAGPKSRKKRVPKAQKEAESATQLESSEAQARSQQKRLQLTPHVSLLLTVKRLRPLPPELHRCILQHVRRLHNRPTLLACGLVCRAWFHFCKQYLFRNIILKSPQQVNLVVECLANPDSGVYLAKSISMEQKEDQPPWGHAVLLRLAGRLPNVREIIFDNSSPFQSGGEDLKALVKAPTETFCSHPSMTMLLPMLFSRFDNLATLRLDLYCFRSLTDLLRLVASLPKLRALGCHRLSWKHIPASSSIAYRRSTCPQLRSLTITRCPSVWPMLHFFDAPAVFREGSGPQTSVRSTICDLVTSSCPSSPPTACPGMDFAEAQVTCEIGALYGLGSSSVNPDLQVKCKWSSSSSSWILQVRDIYHIHELQFHLSATGVPYNNNSPARIREIIFVSHSGLHRTGDAVPAELGLLLSKLPYLNRVVFDAAWDSAAKQIALAGLDDELTNKVEVVLGAAAKAWQGTSRGGG